MRAGIHSNDMLRLATRTLAPVSPQCGLHVMIDPLEEGWRRHVWRIDLAFVPGEDDAGQPPWTEHELWRLHVGPIMGLRLADWRDLENLSLLENVDVLPLINATFENLCARREKVLDVNLLECRFLKRSGYDFVLQMEGEVFPPAADSGADDGMAGDFQLFMELPFASVEMAVPVNATNPLAAAQALAERHIGLRASARSHVTLFDPERAAGAFGHHFNKQAVRLETPWRDGR